MPPAPDEDKKSDTKPEDSNAGSSRDVSRRGLIKAGWSVPVIMASSALPKNAFAQYAHGDTLPHNDMGHSDFGR